MKHTLFLLAILCCPPSWAQTNSPVTVTVKTGTIQRIWQFILGSPTTITSFACTQPADAQPSNPGTTVLMPGDTSTCTVTILQGAGIVPSPTQVAITVPAPLTLNADPHAAAGVTLNAAGILSIPWGSMVGTPTTGTFLVVYPVDATQPPVAMQVWPADYWIWTENTAPEYHADLLVPCCARADLCGLPLEQVSQEPCQAPVARLYTR
jgi:hypothetical protein